MLRWSLPSGSVLLTRGPPSLLRQDRRYVFDVVAGPGRRRTWMRSWYALSQGLQRVGDPMQLHLALRDSEHEIDGRIRVGQLQTPPVEAVEDDGCGEGEALVAIDERVVANQRLHEGCRLQVDGRVRSEEHTSELQSLRHLVCRLL